MGSWLRSCAKVREPSELRFGVVRGVDRGTDVLDGGPRRASVREGFRGSCFRFSLFDFRVDFQQRNVFDSFVKI